VAALNHLHTYERTKSNREIYRCLDPHCTHFTLRERLVGKAVICAKCGQPTLAAQWQLKSGHARNGTKQLTCPACSKRAKLSGGGNQDMARTVAVVSKDRRAERKIKTAYDKAVAAYLKLGLPLEQAEKTVQLMGLRPETQ